MLATPKKARPVATRSDSVAAVLARHEAASSATKATRVQAAQAGDMTVKTLQALLDQGMADYCPELPRVIVTQKPFSVFKKRIAAAGIDLAPFVTYCLREWGALAAQNRAAFLKDPSKSQKGTPLPAAPNFSTLAYRLPYFIAAFANSLTAGGQSSVKTVDPKDIIIARLQAQLANAKSDNKAIGAVLRRTRKPVENTTRGYAPKSTPSADLGDDWTPPPWESQ